MNCEPFAAGIPMPEPISAGHHTLVHRCVEGEKVPEAPVSVHHGVRGLPDMFGRLPELEALLL